MLLLRTTMPYDDAECRNSILELPVLDWVGLRKNVNGEHGFGHGGVCEAGHGRVLRRFEGGSA